MKYKKAEIIQTEKLCEKGCGKTAKFKSPGGILLCESSVNKCPIIRKKNSDACIKSNKDNNRDFTKRYENLSDDIKKRMNWSKGLTKEIDDRIKKSGETLSQRYRDGTIIHNGIGKKLSDEHKKKLSDARIKNGSSRRGIYENVKTILYYVKIEDFYKVGITQLDNVMKRFSRDVNNGVKIEIIDEWIFENGVKAFDIEQSVIKENKDNRYLGEKLIKSGNTEIFINDFIELIKEKMAG